MAFSDRIYRLIEAELGRQLTFSFSVLDNLTRPEFKTLKLGDVFRFEVWAQNNSHVPLHHVRGAVFSGLVADFRTHHFGIGTLQPRQKESVAVIEGRVVHDPQVGIAVDQIGTVSISARPDFSGIRYQESGRPLIYSHPFRVAAEREPEQAPKRRPCSVMGLERAIPLSGTS